MRSTTRGRRRAVGLLLPAVLLLTACGDDASDDGASDDPGAATADDIADAAAAEGVDLSDEEAAAAAELLAPGEGSGTMHIDDDPVTVHGVACDEGEHTFDVEVAAEDVELEVVFGREVTSDGLGDFDLTRAQSLEMYDWRDDSRVLRSEVGEEPGQPVALDGGEVTGTVDLVPIDGGDPSTVTLELTCP